LFASDVNGPPDNGLGAPTKWRRIAIPTEVDYFTKTQISDIFGSVGSSEWTEFVPLALAGRWSQRRSEDGSRPGDVETIFLSSPEQSETIADAYERYLKSKDGVDETSSARVETTALPIPIPPTMSNNAVKLLSQAYSNTPLSKSVLLSLNSLLVNRDGGLFDNLPWSTWSVDPDLKERDAAGNVAEGKFTMGKRVAYQRFMGKDWQGRSLSLGNLANRVRFLLEGSEEDAENEVANDSVSGDGTDDWNNLSQRLLQLEVKEARMEVAECERRLAISTTQTTGANVDSVDVKDAAAQLETARGQLEEAETSLQELTTVMQLAADEKSNKNLRRKTRSLLVHILDRLAEQENPPPYRGAIGYPAKLDSEKETLEDSVLPYTSPYELLLEIVDEQLNSEVMGCVLEPTSLLEGNLVLGGALLLRRKGVAKSTTLAGEKVSYMDDEDALGNEGILPRTMYVVECFCDEAVGVAVASRKPLLVEGEVCDRAGRVPVELDVRRAASIRREKGGGEENRVEGTESLSFAQRVPPLRPSGEYDLSSQSEGERVSSERESNLVRIPLTTNPQPFDGPDQGPQPSSSTRRSVFSTFNPVKSLDEYDELTDDGKARLLLKLESFAGPLPRPRAVRASTRAADGDYESGTAPPSALDDILLPLVDESVRRRYLVRDAERRGALEEAEALRREASPRQSASEDAERAREEGLNDEADRLEEEARLYAALRADVTQDEGAYDRFLDRDDWYERETRARIKRLDKSKFGTLLDGVDLP